MSIADERDLRPLSEVHFFSNDKEMHELFEQLGCKTAQDVIELGDTGLASAGFSIDRIRDICMNMAGAGFGITCYVPPTRYCHVHGGIGGLQDNQLGRHQDGLHRISRELNIKEKTTVELIESARRNPDKLKAADMLRGRELPEDLLEYGKELLAQEAQNTSSADAVEMQLRAAKAKETAAIDCTQPTVPPVSTVITTTTVADSWKCPHHDKPVWNCRYCLASRIVHGDYTPTLLFGISAETDILYPENLDAIEGTKVPEVLSTLENDEGVSAAVLYVRVAAWKRRLSLV